jgi:hypothetical protein
MQVFLMTAISFVRYDILKNQKNEKNISNKIIINSVIISLVLSLFWSVMPILGWSYYSLEDGLVSFLTSLYIYILIKHISILFLYIGP